MPKSDTVVIDGSMGEGGGQVLRSSLALAILSQRPLTMHSIRAGRRRPGLMRQHSTAARAAAEICGARLEGAELGGSQLTFRPGPIRGGDYQFSVGSAGSTTLVLQTILLPLLAADRPSVVRIEGGTHNPLAPSFEYLNRVFLPLLRAAGARIEAKLIRFGFAPAGGGCLEVFVTPSTLAPIVLDQTRPVLATTVRVFVAHLPRSIAERECHVMASKLGDHIATEIIEVDSTGPGNVVCVEVDRGDVRELVSGFGQIGVTAERVARSVAKGVRDYLAAEVPVGRHLADQLLLPLAMAGAGRFRTLALSRHTQTNLAVIESFLDVKFEVRSEGRATVVEVRRINASGADN